MKSGLLWYDSARNKTLATKIEDAVRRYQEKFNATPNIAFVNPNDFDSKVKYVIKIETKVTIMPNHIWMGIRE